MIKTAVLGANPAWQKILVFKKFSCGNVNRAVSAEEFASGKGVNFCRACSIHGTATPILLQFAGGENGQKLVSKIESSGILHKTSVTRQNTRCCITILDRENNSTTECIEPSYAASEDEINTLLAMAEEIMPECRAAAICGTLPGTTPAVVYTKFAEIAKKHGVPLLCDACKGVEGIFKTGCTTDLKINLEELQMLTGSESPLEAVKKLFSNYPSIRTAAITDGAKNAYASDGKKFITYQLPELQNIVSTLGCGDTASAVYSSCMAENIPFDTAFKKALAAASANCLSEICGDYNTADAARIEENITTSERMI